MPILDVEIVVEDATKLDEGLAAKIADMAAGVYGSVPNQVWVKLRPIPIPFYSENGGGPIADSLPVFVSILKVSLIGIDLKAEAIRMTNGIAHLCQRPPENVHVIYEPPATGRVVFGGKLVE